MRRMLAIVGIPALVGLLTLAAATPVAAQIFDEGAVLDPALKLQASTLLPAEVILGQNYRVADEVQITNNYSYQFKVKSTFGDFTVDGMDLLELKLRELVSIEHARLMAQDEGVLRSVVQSFPGTANGPAQFAFGGPHGYSLRPAQGFARLGSEFPAALVRRATNADRRAVSLILGCDPETRNPILSRMLDELAARKPPGKITQIDGLQITLPNMGLLSTSVEVKRYIAEHSPQELNEAIARRLGDLDVESASVKRFCDDVRYTNTQRIVMLQYLESLKNVGQMQKLIDTAGDVINEAEAMHRIQEVRMLAELNRLSPIAKVNEIGMPAAVSEDGIVYLTSMSDYIPNNQQVINAAQNLRQMYPRERIVILAAGGLATAAQVTLDRQRIEVRDHVREGMSDAAVARMRLPNGTAPRNQ